MKLQNKKKLSGLLLLSTMGLVFVAGCQDPGNEPVKDGKTVTSDQANMQKMYQNAPPAARGANNQGAPPPVR